MELVIVQIIDIVNVFGEVSLMIVILLFRCYHYRQNDNSGSARDFY
jgi:hypothetical protein